MSIYACPRCGSRRIRQGSLYVSALTGHQEVCRNCHYKGMPLIFDNEKDYQALVDEIKTGSVDTDDSISLTDEEKDILSYAKEGIDKDEEVVQTNRPYGLLLLVAITVLYALVVLPSIIMVFLSFVADSVVTFLNWYRIVLLVVSLVSIVVIPYGFLQRKQWVYALSGVLFVLSAPLGLIFLYYLTRPHIKTYFHIE